MIKVNNLLKLHILIFLYKKPMYGYLLIKGLMQKFNRKISASQIYPFLKTLKNNNIIKISSTGKRDKKEYTLTKKGRLFVKKLLGRLDDIIKTSVGLKIKVCKHCGCEVYSGGYSKKLHGKNAWFCCKYCAAH